MTPDIGPPKYRAPEVRRTPSYDVQSDIYGYGVMCKQLLTQAGIDAGERRRGRPGVRGASRRRLHERRQETASHRVRVLAAVSRPARARDPTVQQGYGEQTIAILARRAPMDGGTWKQRRRDAESSDEETPSHRSDSDEDAVEGAERGDGRGEGRAEREEETPGDPGRGADGDHRRGKKRRRGVVEADSSGRDATRGATTRGDGEDEEEVEQRAR